MNFQESLADGRAGESIIAKWLIGRGFSVLPAYEKIINEGKGPQLYAASGGIIAPDLVAIRSRSVLWVEAKHKTAFSWHRITNRWVTGIDLRHYYEYQIVQRETELPVWLLFLHRGGHAKDSPSVSPSGLFGNDLAVLMAHENHRHANWGKSGMVYWARKEDGGALIRIATLKEVLQATDKI